MKINGKIEGFLEFERLKACLILGRAIELENPTPELKAAKQAILPLERKLAHLGFGGGSLPRLTLTQREGAALSQFFIAANKTLPSQMTTAQKAFWKTNLDDVALMGNGNGVIDPAANPYTQTSNASKTAEALLKKFGLLPLGKKLGDLLPEKIFASASFPDSQQLLMVIADEDHFSTKSQKSIREIALRLQNAGIDLLGIEGKTGQVQFDKGKTEYTISTPMTAGEIGSSTFNISYKIDFAQCRNNAVPLLSGFDQANKSIPAGLALECLTGAALLTFGVEHPSFSQASASAHPLPSQGDADDIPHLLQRLDALNFDMQRGQNAVTRMEHGLKLKQTTHAMLIYGSDHLDEIKEQLEKDHLNYIIIVP